MKPGDHVYRDEQRRRQRAARLLVHQEGERKAACNAARRSQHRGGYEQREVPRPGFGFKNIASGFILGRG